jgi:hypothetical protein
MSVSVKYNWRRKISHPCFELSSTLVVFGNEIYRFGRVRDYLAEQGTVAGFDVSEIALTFCRSRITQGW